MKLKTFSIIVVFVLVVLTLLPKINTMTIRAPELFGDGDMYYTTFRGRIFGYIHSWGNYAIYGTINNKEIKCHLYKLNSKGVSDYKNPIECFGRLKKSGRFVGWIDFRGHQRGFCGALTTDNIPSRCRGE